MSLPESLAAQLELLVAREQREKRLPSIAAAVLRDGETVWETAVGDGATPDTQYRLGSITKTFTAAAIMQLRDAGKLDLEDTLDRHVEGAAHAPTLRRLLSHTSGLQRETHDDAWLKLIAETVERWPVPPEPWRVEEPPPADVEPLLGIWYMEGDQVVFRWRDGKLEAQFTDAPDWALPAVLEQDAQGRWRIVSGWEQGELLRIEPDRLVLAGYPVTREPGVWNA